MATLYEINSAILDCVDLETGEVIDESKLTELQLAFDDKVEGIACWIKNLVSDVEAIKQEKLALAARQQAAEKKAESLKRYLSMVLDGGKFKTAKVQISFRKSKQVIVRDLNKIDGDYLKFAESTVDKTKVKKALEDGIKLDGVELVEKNNIQIK